MYKCSFVNFYVCKFAASISVMRALICWVYIALSWNSDELQRPGCLFIWWLTLAAGCTQWLLGSFTIWCRHRWCVWPAICRERRLSDISYLTQNICKCHINKLAQDMQWLNHSICASIRLWVEYLSQKNSKRGANVYLVPRL